MNEISIIFYGEGSQIRNHLLSLLQVVRVLPASQSETGFYIVEKKFGQETKRRVSLDLDDSASDSLLVYRYLSEQEKEQLRRNAGQKRLYVLLHQYLDLEYVKENIFSADVSAHFIAGTNPGAAVRHFSTLRKSLKTKNIFFIETVAKSEQKKEEPSTGQNIPVLLLFLAKLLFNPISETRRFFEMMKHSNLRVLNRFVELVFFFDFLLKMLVLKPVVWAAKTCYYNLIFIGGLFRVAGIKIGFGVRHVLLMMGFKSFGVFVDAFNFLIRIKDFFLQIFFYNGLLKIIGFLKIAFVKAGFGVRHVLLMLGFKSFGVFVDAFNALVKAKDVFLHVVFYRGLKEYSYRLLNLVWYRWGYTFFYKVVVRSYVVLRHGFGMLRVHMIRTGYSMRHIFLMGLSFVYVRVVLKIYYGLIYSLYYGAGYSLYYKVLYPAYFGLINFIRYQVRHLFLMTGYKTYGLVVDVTLAAWRFTKLVVLFPVRKLYWFLSFQYEKRLKRYFS